MRRLLKSTPSAKPAAEAAPSVGALLRDARIAMGAQLADVAAVLRIRLVYLQAIEEERYDDLPGVAYGVGFVRSYAEYCGLSPEQLVRRFKEEVAGREPRQELYFPTPAQEGRVPGGTLLFVTLLLAAGVYGGWYYMSATDRHMVDMVPALPGRLVALLEGLPWRPMSPDEPALPGDDLAPPPTATITTTAVPPTVQPPPIAPTQAPVAKTGLPANPQANGNGTNGNGGKPVPGQTPAAPAAPSATAATTPAPVPASPATAPAAVPPSPGRPPAPTAPTVAPPPPAPAAGGAITLEMSEEEAEGSVQEPTPLSPNGSVLSAPATAEPVVTANELATPTGKVYGAPAGSSRLQLRATQEAWVQVKDASGEVIFNRTLKAGEMYRAPDKPGLRLRVGNAGGLVLITDGVVGAPLGAVGQVLRDLQLDSPALRSGG